MFSLQRTLSLGYLKQRWMRAVLVLLSIALGVATMVATRALNRNLNQTAQASVNPLAGLADLMIVNGQAGVPLDGITRIDPKTHPSDPLLASIRSIGPLVIGRAYLPTLENRSVLLLGLEPSTGASGTGAAGRPAVALEDLPGGLEIKRLAAISAAEIARAVVLQGKTPVLVSDRLAEGLGLTPVDSKEITPDRATLPVRVAGAEKQALVLGVVSSRPSRPRAEKTLLEANVVFMQVHPAASLVYPKRPEYATQINLSLEPGADREAVRRHVQELVGAPLKVQTIDETNEKVRDITAGLELGFAIGGTLALMVGLFLVYNVLSVSVAERRHEIGILRSVGATRSQVAGLFVFEALVLGLAGSLLGLPIGYGLARIALGPIGRILSESFQPLEQPTLVIDPETMLLSLAAGLATTILAALVPAVQAAGEEPADVVRRLPSGQRLLYRVIPVCLSLLLIGVGLAAVVWRDLLPLRVGTFVGIIVIFLGLLVATPLLAQLVGKVLQPFFRFLLGLEGRLAADNLVRSPGRTGIVIAALAATGALLVQTAGFIKSSETAILTYLDESIAADLFVTSATPITRPSENVPMDESLHRELLALPGVDAALGIRFHGLPYRDRLVILLALDTQAFASAQQQYSLARNLIRFPRLREPGTVLVSENFAALWKVKVGDHIQIDGLEGPLDLEVVGTMVDYTWNRGTIMVDRSWFREKFRDNQVDVFDIYLRHENGEPPTEEARRREVIDVLRQRLGQKEALHAVTRSTLRNDISNQLRRVYGLAYAQQAVVGIVALLGVISALFISVLQRRRELGLLRAVGASRSQILRSVLAEAVLMGLVGAILGLGIGVVLEWYVVKIMLLDEAGFVFGMLLPWLEAGIVFSSSIGLATLVGLWPAYQATRIRIAEAIAYE